MAKMAIHVNIFIMTLLFTNLNFVQSTLRNNHDLSQTNSNKNTINVLMFTLFVTPSHKTAFIGLATALMAHGHRVTIITGNPKNTPPDGVTHIVYPDIELLKDEMIPNLFETAYGYDHELFKIYFEMGRVGCDLVYQKREIQELLNRTFEQQYDLSIYDNAINECLLPIAHRLGIPTMYMCTIYPFLYSAWLMNSPLTYSYIPSLFHTYTDEMTFFQRLYNAYIQIRETYAHYKSIKTLDKIVLKYVPESPPIAELITKVSMQLISANPVLSYNTPLMPNAIFTGGIRNRPAKELPKELKDFADESGHKGFIYVSFGTQTLGIHMPQSIKNDLIKVFSTLDRRVIWKFEEDIPNLPSNIKIVHWAPQKDILGHRNCKLFIAHGGENGLQEVTYYGVPIIGVPLFGDQPHNILRVLRHGIGVQILKHDLNEENLRNAVNEVLGNPNYTINARRVAELIHDLPDKPGERAVAWIEYVVKHKGAPHLRESGANKLNLFEYFLLDIAAFLMACSILAYYLVYNVIKTVLVRASHITFKSKLE